MMQLKNKHHGALAPVPRVVVSPGSGENFSLKLTVPDIRLRRSIFNCRQFYPHSDIPSYVEKLIGLVIF